MQWGYVDIHAIITCSSYNIISPRWGHCCWTTSSLVSTRILYSHDDIVWIWSLVRDQTIEDIEKVNGSNTQIDDGLIDFHPIPTTKDATHGDASQRDKESEDVDKPCIMDYGVEAKHNAILPQISIEQG